MSEHEPTALAPIQHAPTAIAFRANNPAFAIIQTAIEKGLDPKALCELALRMDEEAAKKEFTAAFAALQAEMPQVKAMKEVPNRDGTTRYRYAPLEQIMRQVATFLVRHGFSVSFSQDDVDNKVCALCTLEHIGGHKRTTRFSVRAGEGPPNASVAQADGAAATYARRRALCDALNIIVTPDTDGRAEGTDIEPEIAIWLREQIKTLGVDEAAFLKFAGASSFETIQTGRLPAIKAWLKQPKKAGPAATGSRAGPAEDGVADARPATPSEASEDAKNRAHAFSQEMPLDTLRKYFLALPPPARTKSLKAAGIKSIVDAAEQAVREVAYSAKLAELS